MVKGKVQDGPSGLPDNVLMVGSSQHWTAYFSPADQSVYLCIPGVARPLRLSKQEVLGLAMGVKSWAEGRKETKRAGGQDGPEEKSLCGARNKRTHRRFIRRCETEFVFDGVVCRGIGSDFSLGGLFIRTSRPFPPDTVFDILIYLPDKCVSRLRGRVKRAMRTTVGNALGAPVRKLKNGMGVEILERDEAYLHFIRSLIK